MIDKAFIDAHLEGLKECVKDASNAILEVYESSDFGELKEGQTIEERKYEGCPRFYSKANNQDPFDLEETNSDPFDF